MDFVAVDVETAVGARDSVCQIGLAWRDGNDLCTWSSLIRPPRLGADFHEFSNERVHGINANDVIDAPTLQQVWEHCTQIMGGKHLIAHNAGFDNSALRDTLRHYKIGFAPLPFGCTMLAARRLLAYLPNHQLPTVAQHFGISQVAHHDAADDAQTCLLVAEQLFEGRGRRTIEHIMHETTPSSIRDSHWRNR